MDNQAIIDGLKSQLAQILAESQQSVYVYLSDEHKFCNENFAKLLGYASAEEWANTMGSFPSVFVDEGSHAALIGAYRAAMQDKVGSLNEVTWLKKDGTTVDTSVILVPVAYGGKLMALHYIS